MIHAVRTRIAVFAVVLLVVSSSVGGVATVAAQSGSDNPDWATELFKDLQEKKDPLNNGLKTMDLPFSGKGTTNLYIHRGTDEVATFAVTLDEDNQIVSMQEGTDPDAKRKLITDYDTVTTIIDSPSPGDAFYTAYKNGDIVLKAESGASIIDRVAITIVNILFDIFGGGS